jgi:diguanylate cyclase (GGDEF)-like protein
MVEHTPRSAVTEEDMAAARVEVRRGVRGLVAALFGLVVVVGIVTGFATAAIEGDDMLETVLLVAGISIAIGFPLVALLYGLTRARGIEIALDTVMQARVLESEARRREFEAQLSRALEMADDEVAAYDTIQRAAEIAAPGAPMELMLADNSHAHLDRVVRGGGDAGEAPGCPVSSPDQCVAARRAQTQLFPDSEALDACPMLRHRGGDPFSAVCVPVSIMGRTVGVVHATGTIDGPIDDEGVQALQVLANQAGHRLGMLRIMAETQLQASTDPLTGLMNRRSLENRARVLRATGLEFAVVMCDLDHFKALNDRFGHETGDRALRVFSETLRDSVRAEDLTCRYGGEEFVVLLPGIQTHEAIEAMERVREELARATSRGDVPSFTASFGIAHISDADDFEDLLVRADRALFAAKDAGRDCICIDGHSIAVAPNLTAIS